MVWVLIVLIALFASLYPQRFFSPMNLSATLRQFVRLMLFALGPSIVVITGSLDLSYVGIWMLGGILVWRLFPILGLAAIIVYPILGLITGLFVGTVQVKGKVPSFILTLSLLVAYWGFTAWISGGYPRPVRGYELITIPVVRYLPTSFLWSLPLILAAIALMKRTRIGTYLYAVGSSEEGARLAGINTDRFRILAFTLSGTLTGLASIVLFQHLGGSVPTELKLGNVVEPLAAIVLGGTPLVGGSGGPQRTVLGALAFSVIYRGLFLALLHPETVQLLLGLLIVGSIVLSTRGLKGVTIT